MPELGSYGSVRGAAGNSRPYRERRQRGGSAGSTGRRPKSAKARSRGKCGTRQSNEHYEARMSAPLSMVGATRARGDVQCTAELKIVQWASRRACGVQQRAAGELIHGYCCERRQPGRTLPQHPRFGMSVAQEYF